MKSFAYKQMQLNVEVTSEVPNLSRAASQYNTQSFQNIETVQLFSKSQREIVC